VPSIATGAQNVDALFSYLGGLDVVSIKSAPKHVMTNLCFHILWELWVTSCIPVRPGRKTVMHYFSCSGGPSAVSINSTPGHVTLNLCICMQWDLRVT
jgi:hypothetical protein